MLNPDLAGVPQGHPAYEHQEHDEFAGRAGHGHERQDQQHGQLWLG